LFTPDNIYQLDEQTDERLEDWREEAIINPFFGTARSINLGRKRKSLKDTTLIILAIVLILVIGGGFSLPKIDLANFDPFAGFGAGGNTTGDKVDVQKPLKFALTDTYAGSALTSKTLKVYASDGSTLLETLTTGADGTINTAFTYDSGDIVWIYYESSNDKMWWRKEVPQMNPKDAEALSYNYIRVGCEKCDYELNSETIEI
jgi:hypothetical protein